MKNTLRKTNFNNRIVGFAMILSLFIISLSGCQQVNDLVKDSKKSHADAPTNSNTAANTNADNNANSNVTATSNANSNTTVNSNANAIANTTVANSNVAPEPAGTPKPPEVKAFESNLSGGWSSDSERVVFSESEIKFYDKNGSTSPFLTWKYKAVDAKTVEIIDGSQKSTATMTFEDNNATLRWKDKMGDFTYKREAAKP